MEVEGIFADYLAARARGEGVDRESADREEETLAA
jgi:hypothetical protein